MSHFVVKEAIRPALTETTRDGVIRELVGSLQEAGRVLPSDKVDVVEAVLRRERLGTTGIGRGIAIPHSRHAAVGQLVATVGLSAPGVPFDSLDGEPVHVFFLLISPQDQPANHLRALEHVVGALRDEAFVQKLRACTTRDEVWTVITGGAGA
jgi:PTS system fructose-specific IIA component/PTS system nitrogen regulatory IIA component